MQFPLSLSLCCLVPPVESLDLFAYIAIFDLSHFPNFVHQYDSLVVHIHIHAINTNIIIIVTSIQTLTKTWKKEATKKNLFWENEKSFLSLFLCFAFTFKMKIVKVSFHSKLMTWAHFVYDNVKLRTIIMKCFGDFPLTCFDCAT